LLSAVVYSTCDPHITRHIPHMIERSKKRKI
jgi:hypothetical protein